MDYYNINDEIFNNICTNPIKPNQSINIAAIELTNKQIKFINKFGVVTSKNIAIGIIPAIIMAAAAILLKSISICILAAFICMLPRILNRCALNLARKYSYWTNKNTRQLFGIYCCEVVPIKIIGVQIGQNYKFVYQCEIIRNNMHPTEYWFAEEDLYKDSVEATVMLYEIREKQTEILRKMFNNDAQIITIIYNAYFRKILSIPEYNKNNKSYRKELTAYNVMTQESTVMSLMKKFLKFILDIEEFGNIIDIKSIKKEYMQWFIDVANERLDEKGIP